MKLNAPVHTRERLWRAILSAALTAILVMIVVLAAVFVWRNVVP